MNVVIKGNRVDNGELFEATVPCVNECTYRITYADMYTKLMFLLGAVPEGNDCDPSKTSVFNHAHGKIYLERGA